MPITFDILDDGFTRTHVDITVGSVGLTTKFAIPKYKKLSIQNEGSKSIVFKTGPSVDGPWVESLEVGKNEIKNVEVHSVYMKPKTKDGDILDYYIICYPSR